MAAIVEELEASFDEDLVRKVATKMYTSFSSHLDAKAVANKIKAKLAKNGEPPFPYYTNTSVYSQVLRSVLLSRSVRVPFHHTLVLRRSVVLVLVWTVCRPSTRI